MMLVPGKVASSSQDPLHLSLLPPEIARHFRFGNQEDAHEFLRYTIDAMQKACLNGYAKYVSHFPTCAARLRTPSLCWGQHSILVNTASLPLGHSLGVCVFAQVSDYLVLCSLGH